MQRVCGEKQIYAYLNEGIVIFNKAFTILYCNNSAVQHLGSDIQGKNIKEFIVANDINKLVNVDQEEKIILNFRTAQGKWVQGKCYLFKQEYMGEMVSTLLIEKYEEKMSWMETKQVLDKLPYLIFIKDINNKDIFINEIGRRLSSLAEEEFSKLVKEEEQSYQKVWNECIKNDSHEDDYEILMREGSLYTERSLQFIGKTYQYALGKWIISDHENKEGKILTISKLRPYVRKHILEENEKFDEESDKLLGVLKINTVLMSRMLGASHIHIFNYNECKQNIEIMSEIEEADDESELFYDVHMTYEEYKAFCAIEEQLSIEELEKRIHCTPLNKWRSQGIVSIRKCPIIFAGDCLGCILITYDHVTEDDFKERQMLSKMIDDVAFLIKNIELYKKVKVELRKTQIAENELRECLNIASDVPMILNRQGDFVRIGKACESILGWKQDEVIGKNIHHFDKSDVIDKIHDIVKQIQETNTLSQGIQKVCIKNGENKWLEWRGKYSEDKSLIHIALRDITEEKEKELERIAYKDALRVENLKNEFVTNISHELKTPVNVVYSTLQLVELELMEMEDELCEVDRERWYKLKKYHHTTRQNVFRLIRLINNITDISEIDAGAYKMKLENYDIVQVIGSIVQATTEYVKSREIRLCTDLDDEEVIVAIDAEKFERVMLNLISNAVKFSSEGCKILIEVAKENEELFIKMSDNGIGIPKEKLGMIFDKFTQVDNIYTRKHEGTGIGLAVVREMLQLMQGEISVESEENEGSSFTIKLPIRKLEGKGVQFFGEKEKRILNCQSELSDIYGI